MGFNHSKVVHSHKVYVANDETHTQNIDGIWGRVKPGIKGVYRHVGEYYLPFYMAEYAFRYNHRNDLKPMFCSSLGCVGLRSRHVPVDILASEHLQTESA